MPTAPKVKYTTKEMEEQLIVSEVTLKNLEVALVQKDVAIPEPIKKEIAGKIALCKQKIRILRSYLMADLVFA